MTKYIAKKLINFIIVLLVATVCIFAMVKLTGMNPVLATLQGGQLSEEALAERMAKYGLDQPVVLQYLYWLKNILTGNLGESVKYNVTVVKLLKDRWSITALLAVFSFLISQTAGILLGILSAVKKNTAVDTAISVLTVVVFAVPVFFMGMLIILMLSKYFPGVAYTGSLKTVSDYVERLTPPVLIMAFHQIALITRVTRSSMIDQLNCEYVLALRAKGISEGKIIFKHALKNGIIPVITISAIQLGALIVGTVLVENVFSLNGLGKLLTEAVTTGDTAVIQGVSLIVITVFQAANLAVDLLYALIDPRIRAGGEAA